MNRIDTILKNEDLLAGAAPAVVEAAKRAQAGEPLPVDEPGEDAGCPYDICGGAGFVRRDLPPAHPQFGESVPCRCTRERRLRERAEELLRESGLRRKLRHMTFDSFAPSDAVRPPEEIPRVFRRLAASTWERRELEEEWSQMWDSLEAAGGHVAHLEETVEICRQYAAAPAGWLVLVGPTGTGKTHLAAAIVHARLEALEPATIISFPRLLSFLKRGFNNDARDFDERFDKVLQYPLLCLDDIGAENETGWAAEKLFEIVDYRHNADLPTVVTTNVPLSLLDDRVASRIQDGAWLSDGAATVRWVLAGDYRRERRT